MKLILFDIDGTLLLSHGIGREAKRRAMLERFGTVGALDAHIFGGKTDWGILADLLVPYGYSIADIGAAMPEYEAALARHMNAIRSRYQAEAFPQARALLAALRGRADALIGLVTGNTAKTAAIKLEMAGYAPDDFVIGAFGSESAFRADLTRLARERACARLGADIAAGDVIVIGDTAADVAAARAIEAVAVAVSSGYETRERLLECQPDFLLRDLGEFLGTVMD